jgi:hypothetical protein
MVVAAVEPLSKAMAEVVVKITPESTKLVVAAVAQVVAEVVTAVQRLAMAEAERHQALLAHLSLTQAGVAVGVLTVEVTVHLLMLLVQTQVEAAVAVAVKQAAQA